MAALPKLRELKRKLFGSPAHDRLKGAIADAWSQLDADVHRAPPKSVTDPWARSAYALLLRAQRHLGDWDLEQGWTAVHSARRALLSNPHDPDRLERAAIELSREAEKITGWRAKAIADLLKKSTDASRLQAIALRDDFQENDWFKIFLRKRHLTTLSVILWAGVLTAIILARFEFLPEFMVKDQPLYAVVLFGTLGGAVSVAQSLLLRDISDRIPMQQMYALMVWMKPAIGAATALAVFAVLAANEQSVQKLINLNTTSPSVVAVFSFIAGYSERFLADTLNLFSKSDPKEKS